MRSTRPCALLIALTLLALLWPAAAHLQQQRGLGTSTGGAQASSSRYFALVIGNNDYSTLPKLQTAEADAREVERLLGEYYGFQTKLLLNARRAQIISALSTYRRELSADANLLIYYAGHGYNDRETEKTYWLPVDAERRDSANWIIADEITSGIRAIPARHVLVVSDSCYSGTLTRGIGEAIPQPNERDQFLQRMAAGRSRTLMASGGDEPVADSGGAGHSVFASALLRGLREMDKSEFTAAELFRSYVEESVAGRAQQTPEYNPLRNSGHESGDFVFIKLKSNGKRVEPTVKTPANRAMIDPAALELSFWESIKNSTDAEDYRAYLEKFPNGTYATLARRRAQQYAPAAARPSAGGSVSIVPVADWIENALSTRIDFGSVQRIDLHEKFPAAKSVQADIIRTAAATPVIGSFGTNIDVPEKWVVLVGSMVDVRAAQAIIAACLKNSNDVWVILLMTSDEGFNNQHRVYLGGFEYGKVPKMSRTEMLMLLEPTLTGDQLHALLPKKNGLGNAR